MAGGEGDGESPKDRFRILTTVTKNTRELLFKEAEKQNVVLFDGNCIRVLAAPIVWALERKLRRVFMVDRGRKSELDMSDCLAMLKYLRDRSAMGQLDREYIQQLNANGFDVVPGDEAMEIVAEEYRKKYGEDIF